MTTPGFVLSLREKVGHDLLMLVGVTAFVEDDEGRLLMGRRADAGEWALVYGIAEPFEEPALSVRREVKEETGVDCVVSELVSVMAQHEEHVCGNGDRCQFVDIAFACQPGPIRQLRALRGRRREPGRGVVLARGASPPPRPEHGGAPRVAAPLSRG